MHSGYNKLKAKITEAIHGIISMIII